MLCCIAASAHPFDRYLQNCCVLYNLINTKLYDSRVSNAQLIMQQLTGIDNLVTNKEVKSVCYYNLAGVESDEPFDGVSIKVTTYSDGTRSTDKIIK